MSLPRLPDLDREIASYAAELVALVDEASLASAERTDAADGGPPR